MNFQIALFLLMLFVFVLFRPAHSSAQIIPQLNYDTPILHDADLKAELVLEGINFPSSFAFLGPDDILVLEKEEGTVRRIVNGQMLEKPLLDVNVATKAERGMLGIALLNKVRETFVYLYYTESKTMDREDVLAGIDPIRNALYRYELVDGQLMNPQLLLDIPATPGYYHEGGAILIGPDKNIYVPTGDVDHRTEAQNVEGGGKADGTSGILRISPEGELVGDGILGDEHPLDLYFAYGIRNSFGIDFDPVTGNLWDTENGPWFGDEINLVEPGFNSGFARIQGIWEPNAEEQGEVVSNLSDLIDYDGNGKYSSPEFIWNYTVGPSAIKFYNSTHLGREYYNDIFVGNVNEQAIYHFDLREGRRELDLGSDLKDKIVENPNDVKRYKLGERFGRITDIEIGPDNNLYVLSHKWNEDPSKRYGSLFRIAPGNYTLS